MEVKFLEIKEDVKKSRVAMCKKKLQSGSTCWKMSQFVINSGDTRRNLVPKCHKILKLSEYMAKKFSESPFQARIGNVPSSDEQTR